MNILLYYKFYIAFILFLLCIKIINNKKSYYNSYHLSAYSYNTTPHKKKIVSK
ncbi:hypothetical protein PUN28_003685 [Cardiocondyla obscurior]|uniref:Uncharacterized protein n=1 Tax=Cardiocondyla obscurior TaxID=286306 RepID=A0AAW2GP66_9HYME